VQEVRVKVELINSLYRTNVLATLKMAKHIVRLKRLDDQLKKGNAKVVDRIRKAKFGGKERSFLSFASKYAHFHNPDAFPIYDKYAFGAMRQLGKQRLSTPHQVDSYETFFQSMKEFRQQAGLTAISWKDLDKFLSLYGRKKRLEKGKKDVAEEIRSLYEKSPELFDDLEPQTTWPSSGRGATGRRRCGARRTRP
jgi:uncharacterized protein (UPF0335 family)